MRLLSIGVVPLVLAVALASCRGEQSVSAPRDPVVETTQRRAVIVAVQFRTLPDSPTPNNDTRVELQIGTTLAPQFDLIAEQPVHLFIVNRAMSWHAHLHPAGESNLFSATVRFPAEGEYVAFSIFKPAGRAQEVRRFPIRVGTPRFVANQLAPSPGPKQIGRYSVALTADPQTPHAGEWTSLIVTINRDGAPVTDLTPTGTLGHIVILREGAVDFAYAHSTDGEAVGGVRRRTHAPARPFGATTHEGHQGDTGPTVTFHSRFPAPGRYKIWAQFTAGKDVIEPEFTVDVAPAPRSPLWPGQ